MLEDQGPRFILQAGDCITQPPEIRHQVVEASDNLEVIEIGLPSDHMTTIDHELKLPTDISNPDRKYQGQTFSHHVKGQAIWNNWKHKGLVARDTGILKATAGVTSVTVAIPSNLNQLANDLKHQYDILFGFITSGRMKLLVDQGASANFSKGNEFVIPSGTDYSFSEFSDDLEVLEVVIVYWKFSILKP